MIEGWMGRGPRKWLKRQARTHSRIIEVGVWKGKSTRILAKHSKGTVWAVDHWQGTPHDAEQHALYPDAESAYEEFRDNLAAYIDAGRVIPVRLPSVDAAELLLDTEGRTFDMVFIDADHSYEGCAADIAAFTPLVAPGGLLCGHDYKLTFPGVIRAVDEAFGDLVTIGPASIWSIVLGDAEAYR